MTTGVVEVKHYFVEIWMVLLIPEDMKHHLKSNISYDTNFQLHKFHLPHLVMVVTDGFLYHFRIRNQFALGMSID